MPLCLVLVHERVEDRSLRLAVAAPVRPEEEHDRLALELGERRRLRSQPLGRRRSGNAGWPSRLSRFTFLLRRMMIEVPLNRSIPRCSVMIASDRLPWPAVPALGFLMAAPSAIGRRGSASSCPRLQLFFHHLVGCGPRRLWRRRNFFAATAPRPSHENASIAILHAALADLAHVGASRDAPLP